ncbi:hypothetical protein FORC17_p078 (plasmid) [Vibrio vulnificus]|nr:hypothetical protein FORC17_p078 [Vibrio vulnificus]
MCGSFFVGRIQMQNNLQTVWCWQFYKLLVIKSRSFKQPFDNGITVHLKFRQRFGDIIMMAK